MNNNSIVVNTRTGERGCYSDWIRAFTELWAGGRSRLDDFMSILSPDVRLIAPGLRSTTGWADCHAAFKRTFDVMPDLTAEIHGWSATGDTLFVEMTFSATIGGHRVEWGNVDRLLFQDGQAIERVAYFNPMRVRKAFLRNPKGWLQLWRRRRSGL